ncbi:MAG: hypothetical protein ABIO72_00770 [Patescibacteria group bacterium]
MADQGGTRAPRGQSRLSRFGQAAMAAFQIGNSQPQAPIERQTDQTYQVDDSNRAQASQPKRQTQKPRGQARKAAAPRPVMLLSNFNAAQQSDRRGEASDESTQLTDSNDLDVTQRSPLDLPARSYTTGSSEETGFGEQISSLGEMNAQRTRDTRMRDTAEQFVGASTSPGSAPSSPNRPGSSQQSQAEAPQETIETEQSPEESDILMAGQLASVRATALAGLSKQRSTDQVQEAQASQARNKKELANLWNMIEAAEFVSIETVVSALALVATMNARLVNKLTVRNFDMIPDLDVAQTALVLDVDCACCMNCFQGLFSCIIMLVPVVILVGIVTVVTNLLK